MIKLGVFFTAGVSLEDWLKTGLFWREKQIYEKHIEENLADKIIWFTYGSKDEEISRKLKKENKLNNKIEIIQKPKIFKGKLGNGLYSVLMPLINKKKCKESEIYKTNQMLGAWSAVIAKKMYNKKLIVRTGYGWHSLHRKSKLSWLINAIENWVYKKSDYAITTSKEEFEKIKNKRKIKNVSLITNYIDSKVFKPLNRKKNKDLVFVGRLDPIKNIDLLIESIKKTEYYLDIYGEGPLRSQIEKKIKKEKIKNVKFKGIVPNKELPKILNQYKIYIQISKREGMPKTILEAMSCGLPIIGTNVEGINEIVNSKNGILCNAKINEIKNSVEKLMKNSELRKEKGKNAREQIVKNNSLEKIQKEEEKIINKLTK